jgi:hypothetical protein
VICRLTHCQPTSTAETLSRFSSRLGNPARYSSTHHHTLRLVSIIILPTYPSTHPTGSVTSLTPSAWSEVLNTHLLYPLSLLHAFLPLLLQPSTAPQPPTLLFLTSTLPSALHSPYQAPESLTTTALTSYLRTLGAEIPRSNLTITTMKLGGFDYHNSFQSPTQIATFSTTRYGNQSPDGKDHGNNGHSKTPPRSTSVDTLKSYVSLSTGFRKGSPLRELHNSVFDAVVGRRRGTIFVGKGSRMYDFVGRWMPASLVGWMLGRRPRYGGRWEERSGEWEQVEEMGETDV